MDVLSDVLLSIRLNGAFFFAVDARPPFATESPTMASICDHVLPGAEHVIPFHVVTEGTCWAETVDRSQRPVALEAGDIVAFPAGDANVIASEPGLRGRPDPSLYTWPPDRIRPAAPQMSEQPGRERTRFVCGFLGCDIRPFNPLLGSLPRIVHAPVSASSRRWMSSLVDAAVQSSGDAEDSGRDAVLAKLAELMFVEALRSHLARLPEGERGWLAAVDDPVVGAALRVIHARPSEPWTLDGLAREVRMSRSAFAERFTAFVQISPIQYLARWRLQLAARMLESSTVTIAQVAGSVGYQSEAAFSRAFKREVGAAPSAWRGARHSGENRSAAGPAPGAAADDLSVS